MKPESTTLWVMGSSPQVTPDGLSEGRPRILYAGAKESQRSAVTEWLQSAGYETVSADDSIAALASLAQLLPAAVILEARLPGLDGFRLCALIKSHASYGEVPVILLGAQDNPYDGAEAKVVDADEFLAEPIRADALVATVGRLLALEASETRPEADGMNRDAYKR